MKNVTGGGGDCLVASGMELEEKQGHVRKTWRCFEPLLISRADRAGNSTLAGGARISVARTAPTALAQLPQRPAVSDAWRHPRTRHSHPHIHASSVGASQHAQCAEPVSGRWAGNTGAQRIHALLSAPEARAFTRRRRSRHPSAGVFRIKDQLC